MTSEIKVDTISENTSANGVTIDGLTIKDGNIIGDVALAGTTPTFTIGDAGAEDAALIFDGNAVDYYIALDDSADDLVIGTGSTIGSNAKMVINSDGKILIGDVASHTADLFQIETPASGGGHGIQIRRNDANTDQQIGTISFGNNTDTDLAQIVAKTDGDSNSGDSGALLFKTQITGGASTERMKISSTGATTITVTDNSDTLSLISTDADASVGPNLRLYRNSGSPADDDATGAINFIGRNDNSQDVTYASIRTFAVDVSDGSEDGIFAISIPVNGTSKDFVKMGLSETVFNEDSADLNFRVESNGNANMLFVDGGNDRVGVGTASPATQLHLANTAGIELRLDADTNNSGQEDCFIKFSTDGGGQLGIAGMDNNNSSTLFSGNTENAMVFGTISNLPTVFATNNTERMQITAAGDVLIGTTSTTINSSNAGIALRYYGEVRIARDDAGATSPVLDVYGQAGQFRVMGDGDVENTNNRIGSISDERIKQNITDANSQWVDIKAIKVRNFERKDDVAKYGAGKKVQIGVVAQEVESVSPGLVKERDPTEVEINMSSEFGTLYTADDDIPDGKKVGDIKDIKDQVKSVGYSVLYMKAIKALQEAMTRIETLEAEVTALKG